VHGGAMLVDAAVHGPRPTRISARPRVARYLDTDGFFSSTPSLSCRYVPSTRLLSLSLKSSVRRSILSLPASQPARSCLCLQAPGLYRCTTAGRIID
jgi:hypothetical protein